MSEQENTAHSRKASVVYDALDGMTVQELLALAAAVDAKRQEKQDAARVELLEKWRAEAKEAGFSPDELLSSLKGGTPQRPRRQGKGGTGKVPVKYRGPGGQEWSGRGRLPQWVVEAEKQGKKRDEFLAQR